MGALKTIAVALLVVIIVGGCGTTQLYPGAARPRSEVSLIENREKGFSQVALIDFRYIDADYFLIPRTLELTPGRHSVSGKCVAESTLYNTISNRKVGTEVRVYASETVSYDFVAGHRYALRVADDRNCRGLSIIDIGAD